MVSAIQSFISTKLIHEATPVTFVDLCDEFSITASRAKNQMIEYYCNTKHESVQCIILCILKNNTIQMIHDPDVLPSKKDIVDMFIYAFNPLETVDLVNNERKVLSIKNPFSVNFGSNVSTIQQRSRTAEPPIPVIHIPTQQQTQSVNKTKATVQRSKTLPESKKDMGLKSTALLARMRKDREEKERQRQQELLKRRQESVVMTQEKKQQLEQLASMFDDDEDDNYDNNVESNARDNITDTLSDSEPIAVGSALSSPQKSSEVPPQILLDTTNEDSLLELSQLPPNLSVPAQKPQTPETYVDDDGYIVTSRPQPHPHPKKPTKRSISSTTPTTVLPKKKARTGQSTLESFFGKKKR